MKRYRLFDLPGALIGILSFIFCFFYFYRDSGLISDSLIAAIISGGLVWFSYILLRICYLAYKE